jgi:hypothetical protein
VGLFEGVRRRLGRHRRLWAVVFVFWAVVVSFVLVLVRSLSFPGGHARVWVVVFDRRPLGSMWWARKLVVGVVCCFWPRCRWCGDGGVG